MHTPHVQFRHGFRWFLEPRSEPLPSEYQNEELLVTSSQSGIVRAIHAPFAHDVHVLLPQGPLVSPATREDSYCKEHRSAL